MFRLCSLTSSYVRVFRENVCFSGGWWFCFCAVESIYREKVRIVGFPARHEMGSAVDWCAGATRGRESAKFGFTEFQRKFHEVHEISTDRPLLRRDFTHWLR